MDTQFDPAQNPFYDLVDYAWRLREMITEIVPEYAPKAPVLPLKPATPRQIEEPLLR